MAEIELNFLLLGTAIVLFHIGMLGLVLNRGNILKTIMSLEILLLSVNLNFITFSLYLDDIVGYIFVFFIFGFLDFELLILTPPLNFLE